MILASAFGSVHDFFHSSTWYVMRNLALFFVLVFWVATIYWVHKDARRRIEDPMLVWVSTLLGDRPVHRAADLHALPPAGVPRGRARARARDQGDGEAPRRPRPALPGLPREVDEDFLICPVCTTKLRQSCVTCHRPLEALWQVCPYCETPIDHDPSDRCADRSEAPPRPQARLRSSVSLVSAAAWPSSRH